MRKAGTRRPWARRATGATMLLLAAGAVIGVVPSAAQAPPPPSPEPLTGRAVFADDVDLKIKLKLDGGETTVVNVEDPSRTAVVRFTLQSGSAFPWHSHAGPVIVNVVVRCPHLRRRGDLRREDVYGRRGLRRPRPGPRSYGVQPWERADGTHGDFLRRASLRIASHSGGARELLSGTEPPATGWRSRAVPPACRRDCHGRAWVRVTVLAETATHVRSAVLAPRKRDSFAPNLGVPARRRAEEPQASARC